ncbi:hypothetical protein EAT1b_2156 [Exiguobacterium sp. AT1b]|uniref:Uncharacterized protein n=1 Tax=Exiguobacterium sp. (strain ATCC BAA-1283 / AT1b) TaxID=360911 RepID=C4L1P7_EXISA|nr:hypothetical protein [Exiguobacterium sp. AT1b]ACQ71079.1 hypothetical protein EAT1b_2156 [Exiguobacterium sp. AT1b]
MQQVMDMGWTILNLGLLTMIGIFLFRLLRRHSNQSASDNRQMLFPF